MTGAVENVPVSEVCKKHGISVVNFYNWQKILIEEGATLFERKPNASNVRRQEAAAVKQVQELEAAVTRKNEVIAEIPEATLLKWKKSCGKAYEHNSWIPRALLQDGEESLYSPCDTVE